MRNINYIKEINSFRKYAYENYLSNNAVLLWYALFGVNNDLYFKEWFKIDNLRLMGYAFIKREATLISARKELMDLGLIEFKKGSKGHPSEYRIVMFSEQEQNTEKEDKDTENTDNNVTKADNNQSQPQNTEHTANNDTNTTATTTANERKQYKNAGYMFYYYKSNKPKKKETDNTYKPKYYKTEYKVQKQPQNRFNNFQQRNINIDALERRLLENNLASLV